MAVKKKTKKVKKKLTIRQKKAVMNLVAKPSSKAQALRDAGYAETTVRAPSKVFEVPAVKDYLNQFIPDEEVYEVIKDLLKSQRLQRIRFPKGTKKTEIKKIIKEFGGTLITTQTYKTDSGKDGAVLAYISVPNNNTRINAVDIVAKLKGLYAPEKRINANIGVDLSGLSDAELDEKIKEAEKIYARKKQYENE